MVSKCFWDKPCYELFGVTGDRLRELWETGVESIDERDEILGRLNANIAHKIVCACSAELWRRGVCKEKVIVNVNINDIEIEGDSS